MTVIDDRLNRAELHLQSADASQIRYAALELRLCIEEMSYAKLRNAKRHLPPEVLEKWQPPQAMAALLEFEPLSDEAVKVHISREPFEGDLSSAPSEMIQIGEHKPLQIKWLKKNYNKLGKLLHAGEGRLIHQSEEYLRGVLAHIREASGGNLLGFSMLDDPYRFDCAKCHDVILVAKHRLHSKMAFKCLNPNCRAEYEARMNQDNEPEARIICYTFECKKCSKSFRIERRILHKGFVFSCTHCGAPYKAVDSAWHYHSNEDLAETTLLPVQAMRE